MNDKALALEQESDQLKAEGKYPEAISKLEEALVVDPKFARAHLALSVLHHKLQDFVKSVAHAEKAVEIEPDDPFNISALSVTYQRAFEGTRDPIYIQKAEEALAKAHGH